jgi:hypothetical protein
MGADLYPRLDSVTTWPISLSPSGLAIFQPFCAFNPTVASALWSVVNLALLAASLVVLRRFLRNEHSARPDESFAWAAIVFLVLASGSLQVGQFSVLFVACWLLSMSALAGGNEGRSAFLLAIPSAIKLYPVMMAAIALSLAKNVAAALRYLGLLFAALLVLCVLLPIAMYGGRGWDLNVSFWRNIILSPTGQVDYMQTVRHANQSVDTLLLRYFSYERDFHDVFVSVPHFWFDKAEVVAVANVARAAIVLATLYNVWLWRRRAPRAPSWLNITAMSAVWCSTLYLLLPETKARYSVYAFPAFLPLLQQAIEAPAGTTRAQRYAGIAEIVILIVLILVVLPGAVQVWGVGFFGALWLWWRNVRLLRSG